MARAIPLPLRSPCCRRITSRPAARLKESPFDRPSSPCRPFLLLQLRRNSRSPLRSVLRQTKTATIRHKHGHYPKSRLPGAWRHLRTLQHTKHPFEVYRTIPTPIAMLNWPKRDQTRMPRLCWVKRPGLLLGMEARHRSGEKEIRSIEGCSRKAKHERCSTCSYLPSIVLTCSFRDEISFFLPILQEPITFDFVRHHSSFLLSAILAVASKYCCTLTRPSGASEETISSPFGLPPSPGLASHIRHGIRPVSEQKWLQIRSLAVSSYFQATISKVHCLGMSTTSHITLMCRGHPSHTPPLRLGTLG